MPTNPRFLSEDLRQECLAYDVEIHPEAQIGYHERIAIESPAQIRPGTFDIDLIGAFSYLGLGPSVVQHVNVIGRFCSIANGLIAGMAEHPIDFASSHSLFYGRTGAHWKAAAAFRERNPSLALQAQQGFDAMNEAKLGKIQIGNDVWIGEGVFIRRGVEIGDGAIIASRAVVNKDVPPYAIVGGVPARVIRYRFEPDVIEALLDIRWWQYGLSALEGIDFTHIDLALMGMIKNIESGRAEPYQAPILQIGPDGLDVFRYDPETGGLST